MSVSSRSSRAPVPGESAPAADSGPAASQAASHDAVGLLLARLTVAPTLLATAFLLASFPFLLLGYFRPVPVIALSVIVAAVIVPLGLRRLPGLVAAPPDGGEVTGGLKLWAQPGDPEAGDRRRTPWWTVASLLVIAIGFFAFQAAYHSQFLIITRDPASYMQFATWIAGHGSLPIPTSSQAFGNDPSLWYQGFAMYQVGNSVVPQFMAGLPMALAVGYWAGGVNAALLLAPFFGAVAIVVFGGLAARLLGARWAPLAALVLAVSLPQMYTSRSTYSEPLAQILFLGALSLVIDSQRARPGSPAPGGTGGLLARVARWDAGRVLAALAGLALGISLLVRIDAPADMLPLIPYLGLMLARRERQAIPMIVGVVVGWVYGWVDAVVLSWPYVFQTNRASALPMIGILLFIILATAAGVAWLRGRERSGRGLPQVGEHWYLPGWLPRAAVIAPFVVVAVFALRSRVQPNYVKEQYAQLTLHWVYWYLGGPAIALATIGVAVLSYGALRGRWPAWALPLMSFAAAIGLFLYRPGITPDQPWASRRLVPSVMPGFILLSVWTVAWVCARLRQGELIGAGREKAVASWLAGKRGRLVAAGVASVCALLLVVPTAVTMRPLAFKRTFVGQVAAIYGLCARIPSGASVIIVDSPLADRISEVVRGMCDVPVARFHYSGNVYKNPTAPTSQVLAAISAVESVGRKPVLLAAHPAELAPYTSTGTVTKAMAMKSTMDGRSLLGPPTKIAKEDMDIWMLEPTR